MHRFMASAASSSSGRAEHPAAASSSCSSAEQPATSLRSAEPPASPGHLDGSTTDSEEDPLVLARAEKRQRKNGKQSAVIRGSAGKWTISASPDQVEVPKHKQTHTRRMPLPFTIDAWIMGKYYERRQYLGHGYSKVCYQLTETLVLKLCDQKDQEPDLFQELEATGVYPKVYASAQCKFGDQTWHAWIVEQAKPLDQILKENPTASNVCIPGAVRAMLVASSCDHILSDNALFNFGMVKDNVVIIDAGSHSGQRQLSRGQFNK